MWLPGRRAAYGEAIESVTGTPVVETWLVLPVAGAGLRIEADGGAGRVSERVRASVG